jgi:hypothetical protein
MHPALMIAVMEERDREIARRTKHAWNQAAQPAPRHVTPKPARRHGRMSAAFARTLAFFG